MAEISTEFNIEVDSVNEKRWNEIVQIFNDANLYQTWAYGSIRWGVESLSHLLVKRNQEIVAAAQIRLYKSLFNLIKIAYIRWGPLWRRKGENEDCEILRQTYRALYQEYVKNRGFSLWVLPNEINGKKDEICSIIKSEKFTWKKSNYRTIIINLQLEKEELRKNLHRSWRRHLNKAEKYDLIIEEGQDDYLFNKFIKNYHEMVKRKNFYQGLSVNEFANIQKILPDSLKLKIFSCHINNKKEVASIVISAIGNTAIYLLGATTDYGLKYSGSYLLHWKAVEWLKSIDCPYYDLSGISPKFNPGGYQFKTGMGGSDVTLIGEFEAHPNTTVSLLLNLINKINLFVIYVKKFFKK